MLVFKLCVENNNAIVVYVPKNKTNLALMRVKKLVHRLYHDYFTVTALVNHIPIVNGRLIKLNLLLRKGGVDFVVGGRPSLWESLEGSLIKGSLIKKSLIKGSLIKQSLVKRSLVERIERSLVKGSLSLVVVKLLV